MKKYLIFIFLFLGNAVPPCRACTAFCLLSQGRYYLAKNLDWPVDDGLVFLNRASIAKRSAGISSRQLAWTSKYTSITFNQFGKEFPLGGMNEKGLVIEELNGPAFVPDSGEEGYALNEFQLVQYLLDCCSDAADVMAEVQHLQVFPELVSLHYLVMDRKGQVLIVEPVSGAIKYIKGRDTGIPVLSNNAYLESLRYLQNYQGWGGTIPVEHRPGSNERFVSAAHMLMAPDEGPAITRAFAMLDTLSQEDTRWSLVYDPEALCIHFRFHACPGARCFSFADISSAFNGLWAGRNVADCALTGDPAFRTISQADNSALLQAVAAKLNSILERPGIKKLLNEWDHYARKLYAP